MASNHRLVEHWASGDDYTRDRRDMWLLEPAGQWIEKWMVEYRRGGLGNPIERRTYDDEEAARWGMAAWMEQCRGQVPPADWQRVP